jgi:hypothetical protein
MDERDAAVGRVKAVQGAHLRENAGEFDFSNCVGFWLVSGRPQVVSGLGGLRRLLAQAMKQ